MSDLIDWNVVDTKKASLGRFDIILETLLSRTGKTSYYSYVKFARSGVCVLPILANGKVLLIKQYRRPFNQWLYELPAGTIDENESGEYTAIRELREETGYLVDRIIPCGYFYPSPGSTTEQINLFVALCSNYVGATPSENEHIRLEILSKNEVAETLSANRIYHAAAVILLQSFLLGSLDHLLQPVV